MNAILKLISWIFFLDSVVSIKCCTCKCDMPWSDFERTDYGYHWINTCPDCQDKQVNEREFYNEQEFYNETLGIPFDTEDT